MGGVIATLSGLVLERIERQRNRPFLEAVMAACAIVATTDGRVTFAEDVRVDQILDRLDRLKAFDPHEGIDLFHDFCDGILADPKVGHDAALAAIRSIASNPADGSLLLRVCIAISEADGKMTLAEQIEIVSICSRFGIDPADCGLYIDVPIADFIAGRSKR